MQQQTVVLRHLRDAAGLRHLGATLTAEGHVQIEGQDLGRGVEAFWGKGFREYEYCFTIQAADVPALLAALGAEADVLDALRHRFADPKRSGPKAFLDEHGVPYTFWSRVGD